MFDLILKRRSVREFSNRPIEKEKIIQLLQGALMSPSSRDSHPCEFIVVDDRELLKTLAKSKKNGADFLATAPLGIIVLADASKTDVWVEDATIAATFIHLLGVELGLGSCWVQSRMRIAEDGSSSEDFIRKALSIPSNYGIEAIIAVGYPAEDMPNKKPNIADFEKVYRNKYSVKF